ncbi:MAG: hypothetical protein LBJ39_00910 [Tannerellaceae bacterium]|jgi:hypothetical protein|nr:hypothetical protein [Tannerellaceae bacterium]
METNTNFIDVVKTIKQRLKPGDQADICRAGEFSPVTFLKACRRDSWDALSKGERHAIETAILYLEERNIIKAKAEKL